MGSEVGGRRTKASAQPAFAGGCRATARQASNSESVREQALNAQRRTPNSQLSTFQGQMSEVPDLNAHLNCTLGF
jgi:hypothetical protein